MYQPFRNAAGTVAVVFGAWRSILMPSTDAVREFPALSETVADAPRSSPSPVSSSSPGTVAGSTPESASPVVQWIVTSPLYQPYAFGLAVGAPESVGFVRSMLTLSTVSLALLPALSVAWPVTLWPAPSPESVSSPAQPPVLMPVSASEQAKVTATGPLFQPKPFAAGAREPLTVGSRLSILTVTELPAAVLSSRLPALSRLQNVILWIPGRPNWKEPSYVAVAPPSML